MKKISFPIAAFTFCLIFAGCGEKPESTAGAPTVAPEAKSENAPEKARARQVTKTNMPSMKYVD
jgi:hypothetical protein